MTREEKRKYRIYRKDNRKFCRLLKKEAKQWCPFDESYFLSMIGVMLRSWFVYYSKGYNVMAQDWAEADCEPEHMPQNAKDIPIRRVVAARLLLLYDDMMNADWWTDNGEDWDRKTKAFFEYLGKNIHYMWD